MLALSLHILQIIIKENDAARLQMPRAGYILDRLAGVIQLQQGIDAGHGASTFHRCFFGLVCGEYSTICASMQEGSGSALQADR